MDKCIIIILFLLFSSCATQNKYEKRHKTVHHKEYSSLRGLMLLENTQLGKNKHFNDKKYHNKLKKTHRKLHKKL